MTPTPGPLWRGRRFATLWAGQTVSLVGLQVTAFAVPLIAALSLGASAGEMGLLTAANPERSIEHQGRMLRFADRVLGGR